MPPTSEGSRYTQIGAAAPCPLSQTDPACSQYMPMGSPPIRLAEIENPAIAAGFHHPLHRLGEMGLLAVDQRDRW